MVVWARRGVVMTYRSWLTLGRLRHANAARQRKMATVIRSNKDTARLTARHSEKVPAGQSRYASNGHSVAVGRCVHRQRHQISPAGK